MKKFLSSAMLVALCGSMALTAGACKQSTSKEVNGSNSVITDVNLPEGIGELSSDEYEALTNSGVVKVLYYDEPDETELAFHDEFKELYGGEVEVALAPWEQRVNLLNTWYAAKTAPDVLPFGPERYMYTIDALKNDQKVLGLDHPLLHEDVYENLRAKQTYGGKEYCVAVEKAQAAFCYVNEDLFSKMGVKSPSAYYKEGNWNFNTFLDCVKKMGKDTDGDGAIDQYGLSCWNLSYFVTGNGGAFYTKNDDGTMTLAIDDTKTINGLQDIVDLFATGGANKNVGAGYYTPFIQGKSGIWCTIPGDVCNYLKYQDKDWFTFKCSVVPYPFQEDNTKRTVFGSVDGWYVCSTSNNAQGAVNFIIARKAYYQTVEPEPGDLEYYFSEEDVEMMSKYWENIEATDLYTIGGTVEENQWQFWGELMDGKTSVSEIVTKWKARFNKSVEDYNQLNKVQ